MRLPALTVFKPNIQLRPEDVYVPISKPKPELKPELKPEEGTKEFPVISIVPYVAPIPYEIPKVEPITVRIVEPMLAEPMLASQSPSGKRRRRLLLTEGEKDWWTWLPPTGREGKDWWTGLMAGFNVLSRYELAGLVEGRKGMHMLIPEIARPYWERFLISAGFASIPVAQQMVRKKGRKRGKKKKKKRRRG